MNCRKDKKINQMQKHYIRNGKNVKVTPANGVKGCLCITTGGIYFFRVYDDKDKSIFKDYDLWHSDFEVTISLDEEAAFYEYQDGQMLLDHSPDTLGLTEFKNETHI